MGDGPRRWRTTAWAWVSLVLFGDGDDVTDTETASTGHAGGSTRATSDGSKMR